MRFLKFAVMLLVFVVGTRKNDAGIGGALCVTEVSLGFLIFNNQVEIRIVRKYNQSIVSYLSEKHL